MNCDNCGTLSSPDQSFCRTCGRAFGEQLGTSKPLRTRGSMVRTGLILCFLGLFVALSGRMLLHVDWMVFVGVIMNLLGMFVIVFPSVRPSERRASAIATETKRAPEILSSEAHDFFPSVTEPTTDLLEVSDTYRTSRLKVPVSRSDQ